MNKYWSEGLYSNCNISQWRKTLKAYKSVLNFKTNMALKTSKTKKVEDVLTLDQWYQEDLPKTLKDRDEKFLKLEELCHLMRWKLARGKFRPRLTELVKSNDAKTVEDITRKAFTCLPDISSAIRELSKLKAVGPATASAILSAGAPETVPFMADEALMAIPDLGDINYNLPHYMKYVEKISKVLTQLREKDPDEEWTAHKVELALWTEVMAKN